MELKQNSILDVFRMGERIKSDILCFFLVEVTVHIICPCQSSVVDFQLVLLMRTGLSH